MYFLRFFGEGEILLKGSAKIIRNLTLWTNGNINVNAPLPQEKIR
ncbi:hypothetical protein [Riemerella anatipestifer]|nr:hypothetical protein [Riemerella anatipestifer]